VPTQPSADDDVGRMQFLLTLRRRGISDAAVLRAMDQVPREHFVETSYAALAYADQALPISCGQTISQPYVVAYMTEQLNVQPQHRVLEVGTGSGYQAAVLSRLAREVISVERYTNVQVHLGDGLNGLPERAPYDRIMSTAAAEAVPQALIEQLADPGVMVLPVGPHHGSQQLVRISKENAAIVDEKLIGVRFVPLLPERAQEL
jgi:protein-L-isoaspartate(D-aspartate) O-methyltransferase